METFMTEYTKQLELSMASNPERYTYGPEKVPEALVRMAKAIRSSNFSKDTDTFRRTCKALKIKHTYKDITHFIANHV